MIMMILLVMVKVLILVFILRYLLVFQLSYDFPENPVQALPQVSDSCLVSTVVIDDFHQWSICYIDHFLVGIVLIETVFWLELGNKVILSDFDLLYGQISWDIDNFDPIEERLEHVCGGIWGTNEDTFGEIELQVQVIVFESVTLLWVEKF